MVERKWLPDIRGHCIDPKFVLDERDLVIRLAEQRERWKKKNEIGESMIQIIKGRAKGDWPLITRNPDKAERFKKDERQAIYEAEQERMRHEVHVPSIEQNGELDGTG